MALDRASTAIGIRIRRSPREIERDSGPEEFNGVTQSKVSRLKFHPLKNDDSHPKNLSFTRPQLRESGTYAGGSLVVKSFLATLDDEIL